MSASVSCWFCSTAAIAPCDYPPTLAGATVTGLSASGDAFSVDINAQDVGEVLILAHIDPSAYPMEL